MGKSSNPSSGTPRRHDFATLVEIMDRLRSPDGCPWDLEQDYGTLRAYLLEECYEVVEAIDEQDEDSLGEELGDLLFQIVFLARIAKEHGKFSIGDVIHRIADKMIRRHPHVFGDARAETADDVVRNWEEIKRREKPDRPPEDGASVLEGVPSALPALQKAHHLGVRAARVGFDWDGAAGILGKIDEELRELGEVVASDDRRAVHEEFGDLLFATVMLARHLEVDPEKALEDANRKFRRRFEAVERQLRAGGIEPSSAGPELMNRLWDESKRGERDRGQDANTPIRRKRS